MDLFNFEEIQKNLQLWPWHIFIGTRVGGRNLMPSFLLILSQITQLLLHF